MFLRSIRVLAKCLAEKPAACTDAPPLFAYALRPLKICTTLAHHQGIIVGAQRACCGIDPHQPSWQRHRILASLARIQLRQKAIVYSSTSRNLNLLLSLENACVAAPPCGCGRQAPAVYYHWMTLGCCMLEHITKAEKALCRSRRTLHRAFARRQIRFSKRCFSDAH